MSEFSAENRENYRKAFTKYNDQVLAITERLTETLDTKSDLSKYSQIDFNFFEFFQIDFNIDHKLMHLNLPIV